MTSDTPTTPTSGEPKCPRCPTCLGLHMLDDPDACAGQYPPENAAKGETQRGGVEG
jgi:hypothetical protein